MGNCNHDDDLGEFFTGSWFGIIFFIILLSISIWWKIYKYHDCKKVGHSTLYCVLDIGN